MTPKEDKDSISLYKPTDEFNMIKRPEFLQHTLPDKYNIDYVIKLILILLDQIDKQKLSPQNLQWTLRHSLEKLLGFLEVEKNQI